MRVAIYARYSSENQRDASITDQFRVCREFAQRQGWHVAAEYSDHAVSGATIMRPGLQAMMREALQKKVDIVMAEALDRFSRDHEDTAGLFKRRSCTRAWPTSTARRWKNSRLRSSARTLAWKPQRCSEG